MLKWSAAQFQSFSEIKPVSNDPELSSSALNDSTDLTDPIQSNQKIIPEFSNDPISQFYIQNLANAITDLPTGEKGFDEINKLVSNLKENIRNKRYGPSIILEWDAATASLDTMTLKDFVKAINKIYFKHFPDTFNRTSILITQWLNQKSSLKTVMDSNVRACNKYNIKRMLDEKRFESERKGNIALDNVSSKTRSLIIQTLKNNSSQRGRGSRGFRGQRGNRGRFRGGFRGRGRGSFRDNYYSPQNQTNSNVAAIPPNQR